MTVNKRKKLSRQRGSWTHGGGEKKKRRGAGHRGGRGNAGTGKRGDVKKPSIQANTNYFGKYGFKSIKSPKKSVNISYIDTHIAYFVSNKFAQKSAKRYTVDLSKAGIEKLLGSGTVSQIFDITVSQASEKAIQKIEKVGGSVKILAPKSTDESEV